MKLIYILILLISIIFVSCKKDMSPIISGFTGIVHTGAAGNIISDDLEDWQPRIPEPGFHGLPQIPEDYLACSPVYPNPFNISTTLKFAIKQPSRVKITIRNSPLNNGSILFDKEMYPGYHTIAIKGQDLISGIYRLNIFIYTQGQEYISYGDIQVIW